jgi:hypothetical protein
MGARVITTRIVQRGRLPELLAGGTHLGQGHYPVRGDSLRAKSRGAWSFSQPLAPNRFRTWALLLPSNPRPPARAYGMMAVAWFESTLSTLLESTDVTT